MPKSSRSWAGVAPEDRRAERRALLLDAAFDLLATAGGEGTTVRAVCGSAGLNPRYFYESFDDLDSLLVAVYDQLGVELREAVEKAVAAVGDPTPETLVRTVVESTVRFVESDRRRGRVLYHEALGNETLNRRRLESSSTLADLIAGGSKDRRVAASFVVGGFSEVLMAWLDGRIRITRTRLIDQTTDLFLAISRPTGRAARTLSTFRQQQTEGRRSS